MLTLLTYAMLIGQPKPAAVEGGNAVELYAAAFNISAGLSTTSA